MGIVLFSNPSKVVRDKRVINAILRRAGRNQDGSISVGIHRNIPHGRGCS